MNALPGVEARRVPGGYLVARGAGPQVRHVSPDMAVVSRRGLSWFDREKVLVKHLVHRHVATVLRMYRVNCVIDVGANHGQYARRLRGAGYKGHIVSFEPVAETFARLQASAAGDPRWHTMPYALGREDGVSTINVVPGTLSSVLAPTEFGSDRYEQLRAATSEDITIRRLDGLLDELVADVPDPRLYLKLDTQGFDVEAFAGLGDRVAEFVGMQSEVSVMPIYEGMPPMDEALRIYQAAGFEITALYPVSRQSRTGRVVEFDCVMVRADAR